MASIFSWVDQPAGHADDPLMGKPGEFAQRPDHRVQGIGDADDEAVRRVRLDALADRLHDLQIDAEQVVAAHAGLAGDAGGDDANVRVGDVGIVAGALELDVIALDGPGLRQVQRLAFGNALGDVEQDDVAHLADRGEVGQRAADHAGANQGDFLPSHAECSLSSLQAGSAAHGLKNCGARLAPWRRRGNRDSRDCGNGPQAACASAP